MKRKILANFLPGFHEDASNNSWWYMGFTEWDNVKNAKPLFNGHDQPRVPKMGYYDLTNFEKINEQAELAKENGISGFIIYNYWYSGKKVLQRPLDVLLEHKEINIEFAICWANHDWTRSWTNRSGALDTLIKQEYEIDDNCYNHAKYLSIIFKDYRYIKINNKPILQIYDINNSNKKYISSLKKILLDEFNIEILIIQTLKSKIEIKQDISDILIYFQPSHNLIQKNSSISKVIKATNALPNLLKKYLYRLYDLLPSRPIELDYNKVCESICNEYKNKKDNSILSIFVDFDNTPRYKKRARFFSNFSLETFSKTLENVLENESFGGLYVINAWNEWGEGMYLEPDNTYEFEKLKVIKKIISKF